MPAPEEKTTGLGGLGDSNWRDWHAGKVWVPATGKAAGHGSHSQQLKRAGGVQEVQEPVIKGTSVCLCFPIVNLCQYVWVCEYNFKLN